MFVFRLRVPGVSLSVALKSVGLFDFLRFVNVVLTAAVVALLQPWPRWCVPCHACLAHDLFAEEAFELYCRHISCMENEGGPSRRSIIYSFTWLQTLHGLEILPSM